MADFNFYLNRQGVKGNKGEKGDTGFAPIVEVAEDTAASYKLRIITDTDTLETPNLRGSAVDDLGGTYMRYDPETQKMYAAAADTATTSSKGEVILASDEAIADLSDVHALTPASLVDNYDALIQSSDDSVVITQDANNSKIDLSVDLSDIEGDITDLQNNKVDKVAGKGLSTNDFTDADKSKLDSSLQPTSVDGTTIVYDSATGKISSTTDLSNCVTLNTNQVISGEKTFTSDNLKVAVTSSSPSHTAAQMDANYYNYYYDDTNSRIGGVILGDNTDAQNALAKGTMQLVSDNGTTKLATIFNEDNLVGGTNVSITRNSQTGKYEVIAQDTVYTESDGIDISNANAISVKVDNNTIGFNSDGELEVVGGLPPSYVNGSGINIYTDSTTGDEVIAVNYDSSYGLVTTNSALRVAPDGSTIGFNTSGQLTLLAQIPTVPTNISAFTNDSGYITGIDSSDVTTALGYTPYDSSNPNGYTSNVGTVTSVNNISPISGNVTISIPTDTSDLTNGAGFLTSVPTATTGSLGLVQPDGTTITINNGVISASSSAPSNMVTTDTSQTISANKSFTGNVDKDFSGDTLRLGSSGTGKTGIVCLSNTGAKTWSICNSGYTSSTLEITDFNSVTIQGGNTSSDSKLVVSHDSLVFHKSDNTSVDLLAGGGSTPSNMATTDTTQTISGSKTFSSDITMSSGNKLSFISDSAYIGEQASGYNIAMVANRSDSQPKTFKVGKEGIGTYYGLDGYFFDTVDGGNCIWLGATNYRSAITTTNGQGVAIYPNPLTNNAQERFYIGLNNTLTYRKSDGTVVDILDKGTVDQTYNATSANAQSGVAIAGAGFLNNSATQSSSLAIKATTAPTTYSSTILNGQSVTGNGGTAIGYGTRAVYMSTALGANSYGQGNGSTAVGNNATSAGVRSLAIGGYNPDTMDKAHASAQDAIQIGIGQNSTASSLAIGFNGTNYQLLDGTTGLIPNARINNELIDGQWVSVGTQIASNVSVNGSTYLTYTLLDVPNDGNKYEVLLTGQVYTSNTSGDNARIQVSSDIVSDVHLCAAVTRAAQSAIAFGNAIIPVGNRQITVARTTGWNGTFNLYIKGYRRIGTNS